MSVNFKCVQFMYKLSFLATICLLFIGCDPQKKIAADLLTQHYPELYDAVYERNGDDLLDYTNHPNQRIRTQAWLALINTPVTNIEELIEIVKTTNTKESWSSLLFKELNENQISDLNETLNTQIVKSSGLISLLGEKGNYESFKLLLNSPVPSMPDVKFELAFAIGKLAGNLNITVDEQIKVIERAFSTNNGKLAQAYLYGFYRSLNKDSKPQLSKLAKQKMLGLWENFYPDTPGADQYIAALLIDDYETSVLYHFVADDFLEMDIQLAIELIRGIALNEKNDTYAPIALNAFLEHKNPNVVLEALNTITKKPVFAEKLNNRILNETALNRNAEDRVRLSGFNATTETAKYVETLVTVGTENPYVQNLRYSALQKVWNSSNLFEYLVADIDTSNGLLKSFLLTELNAFWANVDEEVKTDKRSEIVRNILFKALKEGEPAYSLYALYSDENVLRNRDFEQLISLLDLDATDSNSKITESISYILKNRFEERSNSIIEQLYKKSSNSLKKSLISQDWSVINDTLTSTSFRRINWKRLAKLGPNPIWILETKKGDIEITVDVLSAPATISGIDSLIKSGAYTNVGFHRVVPNFVIQGGDVETGRGNGGPGYTVPTEASVAHFDRGAAGIASSGVDTEGSQYFVMHSWAPHLNGRYTIFGKVSEGMSVVDRITVGDIVTNTYWK